MIRKAARGKKGTLGKWKFVECKEEGCERGVRSMGYCLYHYEKMRKKELKGRVIE